MLTTKNHKDGKYIILSRPLASRAKLFYGCYFIVFLAAGVIFLSLLIQKNIETPGMIIILTSAIILFIAALRFASKALETEKLLLSKQELRLITRSLFSQSLVFNINKIRNFRHLPKSTISNHTLDGEHFDYQEFQQYQQVIQSMYGQHRIIFQYEGKTFCFGDNIYSRDFELIRKELGIGE